MYSCFYSLQQVLTSLQQQQLDRLSDWLTTMESEISKFTFDANHESIQQQLEKHKVSPFIDYVSRASCVS